MGEEKIQRWLIQTYNDLFSKYLSSEYCVPSTMIKTGTSGEEVFSLGHRMEPQQLTFSPPPLDGKLFKGRGGKIIALIFTSYSLDREKKLLMLVELP